MSNMQACLIARDEAWKAGDTAQAERKRLNDEARAEVIARNIAAQKTRGNTLTVTTGLGPGDAEKLRGEPLPQVTAYCIEK
jgi:hypothetical protein